MNELGLTREAAEALAERVPRDAGWDSSQWSFVHEGKPLLVKDIRYSSPFYRRTAGRLILANEERIYRRADGLFFVPKCYGRLDPWSLLFERIDAIPLTRVDPRDLPKGFYRQVLSCLEQLHGRGIVHLDLRHMGNFLVTPSGRPVLVDFESSLFLGRSVFSRKALVPLLSWIDFSGVLKFLLRDFPDQVSEEELKRFKRYRRLHFLWPFHRIARKIRHR